MIPHSRPWITDADVSAVEAVVRSGNLVGPGIVDRWLKTAGAPVQDAFVFASGRAALRAGLAALNLPAGGEVVVQTYVCNAVTWAISACSLVPVFSDIGNGWVSEPADVERVLSPRTAAIILAPPFGFWQAAAPFASYGLPIIADRCQSFPGMDADPDADVTVYSFHPTKYVTASGGGVAVSRSSPRSERLRSIHACEQQAAPVSNLQMALLQSQVSRLQQFQERRRSLYGMFLHGLPARRTSKMESFRTVDPGRMFRFLIEAAGEVDTLAESFADAGIAVRRGVDALAHRAAGQSDTAFARAVERYEGTLSLPFYPALSDDDAATVLDVAGALL